MQLINRQLISVLLLLCGIGYITVLMAHSWKQIAILLASANIALLALSCVIGIASMIVTSLFFHHLLDKHALPLPIGDVHRLFFFGQVAKYVPGKIWGILYQITSINKDGASRGIAAANLDLMVISILSNLSLGMVLLAYSINQFLAAATFFLGLYATVLTSRSILSGKVVGWILSKFTRDRATQFRQTGPSKNKVTPVILYYVLISITGVLAYYLMMNAVFSFSFHHVIVHIAYLILAWVVGVFLFLVPAGIGVRELVFIAFGKYLGVGESVDTLATIAVVSRFWQVFQELGAAAVVFLWQNAERK